MTTDTTADDLLELIDIMARLRGPGGCPWDREQTPETLKSYLLEETYELLEALDTQDQIAIIDELGDLLLQVVFFARIYQERQQFAIADVARAINAKLIRRHPHVFADASADQHAQRWENIKQQERRQRGFGNRLAERIPSELPALKKAGKLARKVSSTTAQEQLDKTGSSLQRLSRHLDSPAPPRAAVQSELEELLFGIARLSTSLGYDPEDLLRQKTTREIHRFDAENSPDSGQQLPSS